jgi:hypothetical protein
MNATHTIGQPAPRRRTSPAAFARLRLAVYSRDGFSCVRCGWAPKSIPPDYDGRRALGEACVKANGRQGCRLLELDHIIPASKNGRLELSNLQTLCNSCNCRKGVRF